MRHREGASQGQEPDWEEAVLPSRNTEWESPFSPIAPVNEELDAVRPVPTYSVWRRWVARVVIGLAILTIVADLSYLIDVLNDPTIDVGDKAPLSAVTFAFGLRAAALVVIAWRVLRWSRRPVKNAPLLR